MGKKASNETESSDNPLEGLKAYLEEHQFDSVFVRENGKDALWCLFLFKDRNVVGKITENETYEFQLVTPDGPSEKIHKVNVNFLCPEFNLKEVMTQMKRVAKGKKEIEGPHFSPHFRNHIKNKSLFPLMNRKEVLFFTLLGGEVLRGIIDGFSRFEIYLNMKRGTPVVILRHAVLDVRDKKNQSYLKKVVHKRGKYW